MRSSDVAVVLLAAAAWTAALSTPVRAQASAEPLSPFAARKAEALLRTRLPCLGCHQLGGTGGRIGPDLSRVGERRSAAWIAAKIRDPAATAPGTLMPRVPMPEPWVELLARYLAGRGGSGAHAGESAAAAAPAVAESATGAALYARRCAACHGAEGRGDGWNAAHLPDRPAAHADAAAMALRPDDVLYDAIGAGGYIMGQSPLMPAFGKTLTPEQIRGLVRHIRVLCRCEGPAWSRDGGGGR